MTLFQALRYFVRESLVSLRRSWRVSMLAVLTIAVSIFLAGTLLLVSGNLARTVREWRSQARLVAFLGPGHEAELDALAARVTSSRFAAEVRRVPAEEARRRFTAAFPTLAPLVEQGASSPLPASLEIRPSAAATADPAGLRSWLEELRAAPGVEAIDDDRDWIAEVETALAFVRGAGFALCAVLIGASIFTIASVVRLTSFLYRDEIAIQRLVGATEFYIRGPFYAEGFIQGLLGGALAIGALFATFLALHPRLEGSAFASLLARQFLLPSELALLVALGAIAGLAGAVLSLGRESLPATAAQAN